MCGMWLDLGALHKFSWINVDWEWSVRSNITPIHWPSISWEVNSWSSKCMHFFWSLNFLHSSHCTMWSRGNLRQCPLIDLPLTKAIAQWANLYLCFPDSGAMRFTRRNEWITYVTFSQVFNRIHKNFSGNRAVQRLNNADCECLFRFLYLNLWKKEAEIDISKSLEKIHRYISINHNEMINKH